MLLKKKTIVKTSFKRITFKRITTSQAKQLFENSHNIYIVPSLENISYKNCTCISKKQGNFENIVKEYEKCNRCIVYFYI